MVTVSPLCVRGLRTYGCAVVRRRRGPPRRRSAAPPWTKTPVHEPVRAARLPGDRPDRSTSAVAVQKVIGHGDTLRADDAPVRLDWSSGVHPPSFLTCVPECRAALAARPR